MKNENIRVITRKVKKEKNVVKLMNSRNGKLINFKIFSKLLQ